MPVSLTILLATIVCFIGGCASKTATVGAAEPANAPTAVGANTGLHVAACTTLSNEEISAVQDEAVSETKGNDSTSGGLLVSHCVYLLPTYSKSLSLDILRPAPSNANALEEFWETRFEDSEKERERDAEKTGTGTTTDRQRSGEREEKEIESKPRPVSGVGDEAFWVGSGVKGTLYVRKGAVVLILSIGGAEVESSRLQKTIVLAQRALSRVQSQVRGS